MDKSKMTSFNSNFSDENYDTQEILARPWARALMTSIERMVNSYVPHWCHNVIQLGEEDIDITQWTSIFENQVDNMFLELVNDVINLREKTTDQIQEGLLKLNQLCKDLQVPMPVYNKQLTLYQEMREITKLVKEYQSRVDERLKEFTKLRLKEQSLCNALEKIPLGIENPSLPSLKDLENLSQYIEKLEQEKFNREEKYMVLRAQISDMIKQLKVPPSLAIEREIMSSTSFLVNVTESFMNQLREFHNRLSKQLENATEEGQTLRNKIEDLWNILEVDLAERCVFREKNKGISVDVLESLKAEVDRCNVLVKENIKVIIEKRREELQALWETCHCDGEQKNSFQYFYSECYSDDLLELHENEIQKWKLYYDEHQEIFTLLEKHQELWQKMLELDFAAEGPNRYKNRGGKLLQEEKQRNALNKKIPILEQQLIDLAQEFFIKKGFHFKTFGRTIEEHINILHNEREVERVNKAASKKSVTMTPVKSTSVLPGSCLKLTASSSKRKLEVPFSASAKKQRILQETNTNVSNAKLTPGINRKPAPTIKVGLASHKRRSIEKIQRNRRIQKVSKLMAQKASASDTENHEDSVQYHLFERTLTNKGGCRSTEYFEASDAQKSDKKLVKTPSKTPAKSPGKNAATPSQSPRTPSGTRTLSTAPTKFKLIF